MRKKVIEISEEAKNERKICCKRKPKEIIYKRNETSKEIETVRMKMFQMKEKFKMKEKKRETGIELMKTRKERTIKNENKNKNRI